MKRQIKRLELGREFGTLQADGLPKLSDVGLDLKTFMMLQGERAAAIALGLATNLPTLGCSK
ncbi:hypothetical protein [Sulfitobacter mediterraneus]|uniref:hypothetical protein n=1 Tax=Sulfitobacter mediterraneus TaxID=83219 RepID=UPI001933F82B|nr:hypothetical protein [Sulfitobacter mediterraneus]QRD43182.1 hypothetical protein JNX03_03535 [Sulfitobacter mediterraneus]